MKHNGDSKINFPYKLLLTNIQVSNLRKAFGNHLSIIRKVNYQKWYNYLFLLFLKKDVFKKTEYNAKMKNIEDKILDISNLATKINLNTKIN